MTNFNHQSASMQHNKGKSGLRDRLLSFKYAFQGLSQIFNKEVNFRIHMAVAILVVGLGVLLRINKIEWLLVIFSIGWVVALEILNSAVERLVDLVSPQNSEKAKQIKDMAAAGVLVAAIVAAFAGVMVFLPHLLIFFKLL
jgi:diacylglycerol kinase